MLKFGYIFFIISSFCCLPIYGIIENNQSVVAVNQEKPSKVLLGESQSIQSSQSTVQEPSSIELIGRIVTYIILLIAIGVVILYFFRQGKFIKGIRSSGKLLKISETHMLGNKQFLVVVEYGQRKLLLGVGPGMISKLCFLDSLEKNSIESDLA